MLLYNALYTVVCVIVINEMKLIFIFLILCRFGCCRLRFCTHWLAPIVFNWYLNFTFDYLNLWMWYEKNRFLSAVCLLCAAQNNKFHLGWAHNIRMNISHLWSQYDFEMNLKSAKNFTSSFIWKSHELYTYIQVNFKMRLKR